METTQTTAPGYVLATYAEIQTRFRLGSADAARIKAKRRKWQAEPPNHPGALTVIRVPKIDWDGVEHGERSPQRPSEHPPIKPSEHGERSPYRPSDQGEQLQAELAKLREEREAARIQAAQAEGEARGLREAVTEARQRAQAAEQRAQEAHQAQHQAETARQSVEAEKAILEAELAAWSGGNPLARAWRALWYRRVRQPLG